MSQSNEDCPTFEAVAELGKILGLNKSASLALALLFTEETPLPLDEIARKTGIAKSSISVILKNLEQLGLAIGVTKTNDRRKYYRITDNPGDAFAMVIARYLDHITVSQQEVLAQHHPDTAAEAVDNPSTPGDGHAAQQQLRVIYQSLAQLAAFFRTQRADAWPALCERLALDKSSSVLDRP
jgi:DNA-binding transcriptional regulator GbsR (MarR family)